MKIIHLIGGGDVGGAKTHVLSLVSKLSETNDVLLVSFRDGEFADDAKAMGIKTHIIHNGNPLKDMKELRKLICDGFDIVHCHGAKANVMAMSIKRHVKVPIITTVHSDYRLDYMGNFVKKFTNGLLNTIALRALDGYVGVTDNFADMLIDRGFDPYSIRVIYNGLDFDYIPKPKCSREEFLKNLGIPCDDDAIVCGIAARLHPVKDIATIVRAFAKIREACPKLYLIIGGDGEQKEFLTKLVAENNLSDRIIFAGWVSDMDTFLNAIDINLLSSLSESFPYSVLEAVRSKCTMVVSAVGGMPVLIDHGENGFLFTPQAVDELSSHLEYLYKNPDVRRDMAEKLLEKAGRLYSINKMVKDQIGIYESFLEAAGKIKDSHNKVVVCGSYGRGNAGDDAILKAVIQEVYEVNPTAQICVMSKKPKQTRRRYRVRSIYTFNVIKMFSAMRKSHLYINGGGSLIQDSTSSRSLYFYLMTLRVAHMCGCKIMMYGCGIGPVRKNRNKKRAAKVIDKKVDCITLRDPDSLRELREMGVSKPDMCLAADPTLGINPTSEQRILNVFQKEGITPDDNYLCLAMRNWDGIDEKIPEFAKAAEYASEKYGLKILLIPMEHKRDLPIAEKIREALSVPTTVIQGEYDVHTVIGILSRMRIIMAMRLHALVFGAGQGVSTIGIAYDHKVTGFMNYIGREMCTPYDECSAEILMNFIDKTMSDTEYSENMHRTCMQMRENEKENVAHLRKFFNREVDKK
ncbi:MAG: polysaccharide pyruvyl transferase CsaB [Oscillospiraceae bacterium]|nr:polysaccharide pyruvyl transferase CsaB [Oscillospiraceae bacterium]